VSTIDTAALPKIRSAFRPSFYFWTILVMCFLVFTGFGMTYWIPLAAGRFPPAPPIVHIHGLVFSTWMILLLVQSALVNTGNVALHRSLGTYGIAHAAVMMYTGALIQMIGLGRSVANGATGPFDTAYIALMAVVGFGFLFTLAIRNVRRPEAHKRLMLFAVLPVIPPGVNRFYQVPFGLNYIPVLPLYLTLDALVFAILIHEWRTTGKIGKYSIIGGGLIVLQGLLHVPIVHTEWFTAGVRYFITEMVRYR